MSDSKENKKKGFFSRLFGGSSAPEEPKKEETRIEDTREIPTKSCLLYTSPSPRDRQKSRMPSSA